MKLVIDISEELYEEAKFKINRPSTEIFNPLTIIVGNGTPLSESEDCISRQAVLALAKEECDTAIIPYRKFVKDVNSLPPVTTTWIPVSERLPNLDDFTGINIWQKEVLITGYLSFDDTKELFVSETFAEDVINNSVHDIVVTAWMPLPEPYKQEVEE